jgi:hypothetical protein
VLDRLRVARDGDEAGVEAAAVLLARIEGGLRRGDAPESSAG